VVYLGLAITIWGFMAAVMAASWIAQRRTENAGWTDAFWSFGSGAALALSALYPLEPGAAPTLRQVLVAVLAAAATAWGILLAALARTPGQVTSVGSAMMLTFGILGGNFVSVAGMPEWFRLLGKITPNAWGLDGFVALGLGDGLPQIAGTLAGLLVMAVVLFLVSVWILRRRSILRG